MGSRELWWDYAKLHAAYPEADSAAKVDYYKENSRRLSLRRVGGAGVAVVVVAHNEQDYLPRALASLDQAVAGVRNNTQVELVVVDNASTDATADVAQAFGVKVVREPVKRIGQARQTGLEATSSTVKHVLSTDADIVVGEDWIKRYLEVFGEGGLVLAYGRIRGEFDNRVPWSMRLQRELLRLGGASLKLLRKARNVGLCVCSGNLAFSREAAIEVGGYDTSLKGGEDGNLRGRLEKVGGVAFVDGVDVLHSRRRQVGEGLMANAWRMAVDEVCRSFGRSEMTDLQREYSHDYR